MVATLYGSERQANLSSAYLVKDGLFKVCSTVSGCLPNTSPVGHVFCRPLVYYELGNIEAEIGNAVVIALEHFRTKESLSPKFVRKWMKIRVHSLSADY